MRRFEAFRRARASLTVGLVCVAVLACSSPYGFSLQRLYNHQQFSGKQLGDRTIVVGPVLTQQGPDTIGELDLKNLLSTVRDTRPDLTVAGPDELSRKFLSRHDGAALDTFFNAQFEGNVLRLQSMDSLWALAGPRAYFMVLRLKTGMRVKSFEGKTSRRMTLEGELWDCDSSEVLWRMEVRGTTRGSSASDRNFVLAAVAKVYGALPRILPAHESGPW